MSRKLSILLIALVRTALVARELRGSSWTVQRHSD